MLVDIGEIFTSLQVTTKQTPPPPLTLEQVDSVHIEAYSISRVQLEEDKGTKGLVYANKFMLIARQSQPDSPDWKMARFGFCAAPSLILGGGDGNLLFHFILSKSPRLQL